MIDKMPLEKKDFGQFQRSQHSAKDGVSKAQAPYFFFVEIGYEKTSLFYTNIVILLAIQLRSTGEKGVIKERTQHER